MQKSKKIWSRCVAGLAVCLCVILGFGSVSMAAESYNYDIWGNVVAAPAAYELENKIYASDMGLDSFSGASGVFYRNEKLYITMGGCIVIADKEFEDISFIRDYVRKDGTQSAVNKPSGLFVTEEGHIYVCEPDQGEIIEFDEKGKCLRVIGDPNCTGLATAYKPYRMVVDSVGRMYVLVQNCYEGFAELDPEGNFNRYVGATEVTYSMWSLFWRNLQTEEQRARTALWLPTSYSDVAIDKDGFLYASVSGGSDSKPVKKLNSAGDDVMTTGEFNVRPMGDYKNKKSLSNLGQVAVADDGRFAVLDSNQARIFVYSPDGYLMYELAGKGNVDGLLSSPVAFCFMEEKIVVVDLVYETVEIFAPTTYGALINSGLEAQSRYDYEEAAGYWQQVLDINGSFYYANLGLGKYQMRTGDYEAAQENFFKGGDRSYYSSAYKKVSGAWMDRNFGKILAVIIVLIALVIARKVYKKFWAKEPKDTKVRRIWKKVKFTMFKWPGYMLSSPFKAFDDVKYYDDGSLSFSVIVIIAFGWISLIQYRYTGFLVSFVDIDNVNVPLIVGSTILPYVAFIIGNWAVGVLLSGKGKVVHITKVVGYSLYPACWLYLAGTLLSNFVSEDEAPLVSALFVFGMVLFFFYMFIGTIMVNQYTFTKNVATLLLSVVAILIICFVAMLFATLLAQFVNDWIEIIREFNMLF
ncbi:MAG: hypothetical protein HFH91_01515 [Lachnospiraceae bacterium]|nr:hypothetical protein [Lachnospiraceae bacterium]